MAATKRRKKRSAGSHKRRHNKRNPAATVTHRRRRHHRVSHRRHRRNPGSLGLGGVGPLVTNAVFVIVGALGSKLGAQAVLGSNNTGLVGYAGNAAAGGVLWFLAAKVMKNHAAASGVLAGTAVQIVLRLLNDYTPFGQYLSQAGFGDYQAQAFVTPQVLVSPLHNADIAIPNGWAPTMIAPPPAQTMAAAAGKTGMGAAGSMFGGRNPFRMY